MVSVLANAKEYPDHYDMALCYEQIVMSGSVEHKKAYSVNRSNPCGNATSHVTLALPCFNVCTA